MKYIIAPFNADAVRRIAGEIVNITYGITYFDKGVLLKKPKTRHNTYDIDGVEYDIVPTLGYVIFISNEKLVDNFKSHVTSAFYEMCREVTIEFGTSELKLPTGLSGTTQYLLTMKQNGMHGPGNVTFVPNRYTEETLEPNTDFVWSFCLVGAEKGIGEDMPITSNGTINTNLIASVSTIVVDTLGVMAVPDEYRHINYPTHADFKITQTGHLIYESFVYSHYFGLHKHMATLFGYKNDPNDNTVGIISKRIRYVKWEDLIEHLYTNINNDIDPIIQIKKGLFDREHDKDLVHSVFKCGMTGQPLFEDCYVFDIYRQRYELVIPIEDLGKYPDAQIVEVKKDLNPEENKVDETDTKKKKGKAKTKAKTKGKKVSDKKVSGKKGKKDKTADQPVDQPVDQPSDKTSDTPKFVTIQYYKNYNKPKCILISPYYLHCTNILNTVKQFENQTGTNVLVYRTFCPRTLDSVIDSIDMPDVNKHILKCLNKSASYTQESINTDKYILYKYEFNLNPHLTKPIDESKIYAMCTDIIPRM